MCRRADISSSRLTPLIPRYPTDRASFIVSHRCTSRNVDLAVSQGHARVSNVYDNAALRKHPWRERRERRWRSERDHLDRILGCTTRCLARDHASRRRTLTSQSWQLMRPATISILALHSPDHILTIPLCSAAARVLLCRSNARPLTKCSVGNTRSS